MSEAVLEESRSLALPATPSISEQAVVHIVDDEPSVRDSLRWLLEGAGWTVHTFASAAEYLALADREAPHCLVLDYLMPEVTGLDLQRKLRDLRDDSPVVLISAHGDVPTAVRAMQNGAVTFLEKPVPHQLLLDWVRRAAQKSVDERQRSTERDRVVQNSQSLTAREQQVMWQVVDGRSSKEIGGELKISAKTIEAHRAKIMQKMGATNVAHLVQLSQWLKRPDALPAMPPSMEE